MLEMLNMEKHLEGLGYLKKWKKGVENQIGPETDKYYYYIYTYIYTAYLTYNTYNIRKLHSIMYIYMYIYIHTHVCRNT